MGWKDRLSDLGLKDRLKETTAQATAGIQKGQAKLNDRRDRQSVDGMLQALGQAYWVQQSGRATPDRVTAFLASLRPSLAEGEARFGQLPWPSPPETLPLTTTTSTSAGPTPAAAPPNITPVGPSDLIPGLTPAGPGDAVTREVPPALSVPSSLDEEEPKPEPEPE